MVLRARAAGVPLVPVLLTSPSVPEVQREQALNALAAACGVEADAVESTIRVIELDDALLLLPPPVAARWPPLLRRQRTVRPSGSLSYDSDAMAIVNTNVKINDRGAASPDHPLASYVAEERARLSQQMASGAPGALDLRRHLSALLWQHQSWFTAKPGPQQHERTSSDSGRNA